MMKIKERKTWIALLALLALFAACKGETPTAPPPGGGIPPGGSTPPVGANLVLTASNTSPIVDSTVVITATVTQNNNPVPNGTAVEFTTTAGLFTDVTPGVTSIIRTTTNGVATVNLSSSTPGLARVTATVNNITRFVDVTFRAVAPCVPPDPRCPIPTTPTITSVSPTTGRPQGGETIRITGTNFIAPLRVLFDFDNGQPPVEAFIVSSSTTHIDVITPAVNLGPISQEIAADIIVITKAGQANEERAQAEDAFRFRAAILTPVIHSLSPTSGPINGGTRVTISGTGFQAPMQVFFGSAEAQVVQVEFSQVIVIAPDARSTNPNGSGTVTGPVAVTVTNIASNTRASSPQDFRYVAAMQITAISPLVGSALGGTEITIDGVGFDAPVQVLIAGNEAQVIRVSGTQVVVRTRALASACEGASGTVTVTNIENGDTASSSTPFTFIGVEPQIVSITTLTPPIEPGETITVTVDDPGVGPLGTAIIRFTIVDRTIIPSPSTINDPTTPQPFQVALPLTGFTFPTIPCSISGSPGVQLGPVEVPITFLNTTTGCSDTATVVVTPPSPNPCIVPPQATVAPLGTPGNCAVAPDVPAAGTGTTQTTIRITNSAPAGSQNLNVTSATVTGTNGTFTIAPPNAAGIAPGSFQDFIVTIDPTAVGPANGTATFNTNDPNRATITVCVQTNGTP